MVKSPGRFFDTVHRSESPSLLQVQGPASHDAHCAMSDSARFIRQILYPSGNRSGFRLTAWFNALVSTPYSVATSQSINTDFILSAVLLDLKFYKTICNTIQQSNPLQLYCRSHHPITAIPSATPYNPNSLFPAAANTYRRFYDSYPCDDQQSIISPTISPKTCRNSVV